MKRTLNKRQAATLEVISKPKIPTEIQKQLGLTRDKNVSSTTGQLIDLNLIYCLNPQAKTGKLFGLTKKGQQLRRKLLKDKNIIHDYTEPAQLNWNLYGWIICGRQKRAILRAMRIPLPLKYIKERAQEFNPRISRMNANDILQFFVKRDIARKIRNGNRVFFSLTKTGESLRNQLLEP